MSEQKESYRQIMKATSIFGGVQVFNIVISIIRSKFVAVLLGPTGMGIVGLFMSTLGMIASITNFGLGSSAVRDIATAHATNDEQRMSLVTAVFRKWVWVTGLLGAAITLITSPWLSELTFGNRDYTFAFVLLSVTLLINQLTSGQNVMLQGTRQLKYLASANIIGSVVSLVVAVSLYYFYGSDGIVPAIIVMSIMSFLIINFFARKINIPKAIVTIETILSEGKGMLRLGFLLSLSGLIATLGAYLVRIYISNTGSIEDVGLFSAGFAIITTYVGMIFTAMATDYYPRLAGVAKDNNKAKEVINQQAEVALLILGPILIAFILFIQWIVIILYSQMFTGINDMILWAAIGMFFKASSWPIGFQLIANGDSKLFFWNELVANIYILALNIVCYSLFGLKGLGISFLLSYILYFIQVYVIASIKYQFSYHFTFYKTAVFHLFLGGVCFIMIKNMETSTAYLIGSVLFSLSIVYSVFELNKKLNFLKIFKK